MVINIDGTDISSATIDGQEVQEITIDGDTVYTAVSLIDDFEDGNINEYKGNTNSFSVTTDSYNGTYALEGEGLASIHTNENDAISLDNYPNSSENYTITYWYKTDSSTDFPRGGMYFDVDSEGGSYSFSPDSGYVTQIYPSSDVISVSKVDGDGQSEGLFTVDSNTALSNDTWYKGELIRNTDGYIEFNVYDTSENLVASGSTTDNTYSANGIGFEADSGVCYWDDIKLQ